MNTGQQSNHLRISDEQRSRAEAWLQEAYADGRLDAQEFDERMGQVLEARTRGDLNRAFHGLTQASANWTQTLVPSVRPPATITPRSNGQPDVLAGVAHLSPLVTSFIGPLITLAIAQKGTFARRQSAEALNFQILVVLGLIVASVINPLNWLAFPITLVWLIFTIHGGIKALQGEEYRNPVLQATKFRPVKP